MTLAVSGPTTRPKIPTATVGAFASRGGSSSTTALRSASAHAGSSELVLAHPAVAGPAAAGAAAAAARGAVAGAKAGARAIGKGVRAVRNLPATTAAGLPKPNSSASSIVNWAKSKGWTQRAGDGPRTFVDRNGVARVQIKQGAPRVPGSEGPHAAFRNAQNQRIDVNGNVVSRRSPANHTPIRWDLS